jgi:hypothetical protein
LAVIGQTDVYLADLQAFRSVFGLSAITGCTTDANGLLTACTASSTAPLQYVLVNSDPGSPLSGDLVEADLDLEWSGAVARNAQIIYVNAPDPVGAGVVDAFYYAIDNATAPVISLSYGICEWDETPFIDIDEAELASANLQGITFVNSSGDAGAAACDYTTTSANGNLAVYGLAVSWPSSSQYATGVGGTATPYADFTTQYWDTTNGTFGGNAKSYVPEQAWNDDDELAAYCVANPGACDPAITTAKDVQTGIGILSTGGGASNCVTVDGSGVCTGGFPQPSWQTVSILGQASARFVPDVSLPASPIFPGYIFCTPQSEWGGTLTTSTCATSLFDAVDNWQSIIGGTSASAPSFAGMVALLNQYLQGTSPLGLGNVNPMLYSLAQTNPNNYFHSVNTGNNFVYCVVGEPSSQPVAYRCPASGFIGFDASSADTTSGYNLVTGLGSVDLNNLAIAWAAGRAASSTTLLAAPTSVVLGQSVTLTATVVPATAIGTVSFFDNGSGTALGTASLDRLSNGVGSFTWTPTASQIGTNNITASYSGDGYNLSSTTATASTVTVISPDFTWAAGLPKSHTVLAGQTSQVYTFTATPIGSATFAADVTFAGACSFSNPNSPNDSTLACAFNTGQADPTKIAAGSGTTVVQMTITTKGPNTGTGPLIQHRADGRAPWLPLTLPIAGVVLMGLMRRRVSRQAAVVGLCLSLTLLGLLIACGNSHPITVSVTPSSANLYPNVAGATNWPAQTTTFSATVDNTSQNGVNWSISPASAGSIDSNGKYTAPATVPNPATVTVTATSTADSSKTGMATVHIQTPTGLGTFQVMVTAKEATTQRPDSVTLIVQ